MSRPLEILLVEDDPAHARLTLEALKESKLTNRLYVVGDGEQAMAWLRREDPYTKAVRPDLILLDLNMPKKDGRETLADIKSDERFKRIPVVILTMSQDEQDLVTTYNLHANAYITKPVDLIQFIKVVRTIEEFWLTIVKLPSHDLND
jgi:CheY-like chemotaxis protein